MAVAETDDLAIQLAAAARRDLAAVADGQAALHAADLDQHALHGRDPAIEVAFRDLIDVRKQDVERVRQNNYPKICG